MREIISEELDDTRIWYAPDLLVKRGEVPAAGGIHLAIACLMSNFNKGVDRVDPRPRLLGHRIDDPYAGAIELLRLLVTPVRIRPWVKRVVLNVKTYAAREATHAVLYVCGELVHLGDIAVDQVIHVPANPCQESQCDHEYQKNSSGEPDHAGGRLAAENVQYQFK